VLGRKQRSDDGIESLDFAKLLEHFRTVQAAHDAARRMGTARRGGGHLAERGLAHRGWVRVHLRLARVGSGADAG